MSDNNNNNHPSQNAQWEDSEKWTPDSETLFTALLVSAAAYEKDPARWLQQYEWNGIVQEAPAAKMVIALHKEQNTVYIGFRGTDDKEDIYTDLTAVPMWKMGLTTHRGFLHRAQEAPFDDFVQICRNTDWTIIFCGHSLGGAVSHCVALQMLLEKSGTHNIQKERIKSIAFGAPFFAMTVNDVMIREAAKSLFTVVNQEDLLARSTHSGVIMQALKKAGALLGEYATIGAAVISKIIQDAQNCGFQYTPFGRYKFVFRSLNRTTLTETADVSDFIEGQDKIFQFMSRNISEILTPTAWNQHSVISYINVFKQLLAYKPPAIHKLKPIANCRNFQELMQAFRSEESAEGTDNNPVGSGIFHSRQKRLNVLVFGEAGSGKTSFGAGFFRIRSIPSQRGHFREPTKNITLHKDTLKIGEGELIINYYDCPGFESGLDIHATAVFEKLDSLLQEREKVAKPLTAGKQSEDPMVHLILYFITPHRFRKPDLEAIKKLSKYCVVIPLLAKFDCMSPAERKEMKDEVKKALMDFIPQEDLKNIYDDNFDVFGVMGCDRQYPWGLARCNDREHSENCLLRSLLTHKIHNIYEIAGNRSSNPPQTTQVVGVVQKEAKSARGAVFCTFLIVVVAVLLAILSGFTGQGKTKIAS